MTKRDSKAMAAWMRKLDTAGFRDYFAMAQRAKLWLGWSYEKCLHLLAALAYGRQKRRRKPYEL